MAAFWKVYHMALDLTLILILAATFVTGLLAGTSLDKAVVQLPARHRMGLPGFVSFSRANDLGKGLIFYPAMGTLAALLTIGAALSAFLLGTPLAYVWLLYTAAGLAILHSAATAKAAPNMLSLRNPISDEAVLASTLDRFAAWHNARTVFQVLNFVILILAIVSFARLRL
jgi:hypothetical protein